MTDKAGNDFPQYDSRDTSQITPDWQKTLNDDPSLPRKISDKTSSAGQLNASGMPIPEMLINRTIGSGKIVDHIGSGGMGDVYKIWNENVCRFHAVKLLKRGGDAQAEKRFEREIKVTATFDHANIIHVYGAGRWKGYLFLEMEYVKGKALDELLQLQGHFPQIVCSAIGVLVASALQYAHTHTYTLDGEPCTGVVHRDLKPSNIMLADDGRLKLMDFGIAKPVGSELTSLTMGIVGSWVYLPPEQLDKGAIDHRADIYTLGEVLYELLTGKPTFVFETQREFLKIKTHGKYVPLSAAAEGISGAFARIIDKCLKIDPDGRYQTALDVKKELSKVHAELTDQTPEEVLSSFVAGKVLEERRNTGSSTRRFPEIHRPVAIGLLSVFAAVCAVAIVVLMMGGGSRHASTSGLNTGSFTSAGPEPYTSCDTFTTADTIWLRWHPLPSVKMYLIQLASSSTFSDTLTQRIQSDTASAFGVLRQAGMYYWRAAAVGSEGTIAWSVPCSLIIIDAVPGIPELMSPKNGAGSTTRDITLEWDTVASAGTYRLQIALNDGFEQIVFDTGGCIESSLNMRTFKFSTTYFWRVRAENLSGIGEWSAVFTFTVKGRPESKTPIDHGEKAVTAIKNNRLTEAESEITGLSHSDPRRDTLLIRLAEKYLNSRKPAKTKLLLKSVSSFDMFAELLRGRLLLTERNCIEAFKVLDRASGLTTKFNSSSVSADVSYFRALAANCCYGADSSIAARKTALNAWRSVCKLYKKNRAHPRYVEAARQSSRIADR